MNTADIRILVIDDDPTARILFHAALRRFGFEVSVAESGEDGLRQFNACPFDMVLLDIDMPGMSGIDVCKVLRAQADPLLPIMMVTGMDDVLSVEQSYAAGATDFIVKPMCWSLISHRVMYLLRGHQTVLDLRAAHARIEHQATFDTLTAQPHRQAFGGRLQREIKRAGQSGTRLAVLLMDVDGLKTLNDPQDVLTVAQRIMQRMCEPQMVNGQEVRLDCSMGVAVFPDDGEDGATLLQHADTALYEAKDGGPDKCQLDGASRG